MSENPVESEHKPEAQSTEPAGGDPQAEVARLNDELLRALAETENVRKRGERALADARQYAIDRFAKDLLPIADHLARALSQPADGGDPGALREGVAMTEKALLEAFARHGLRRIGAGGEAFDPNLHQAMAQIPSETPAGAVVEVMQFGFALGERTLRPAMVVVSAGPAAAAQPAPEAQGGPAPGGSVDVTA